MDVINLELNHALHLSDLKLPEGVRIVQLAYGEEHNLPVVSIHHPRINVEEEPVAAAAVAAEGAAAAPAEGAAPLLRADGKPGADAKAARRQARLRRLPAARPRPPTRARTRSKHAPARAAGRPMYFALVFHGSSRYSSWSASAIPGPITL